MAAVVGGRQFPYITARNKKDGKTEAAEVAVRILMSEEQIKVSHSPVAAAGPVSLSVFSWKHSLVLL